MKSENRINILLLFILLIGFASCKDEIYYTMENSDEKLCSKVWVEEYITEDGDSCVHQLKFTKEKVDKKEVCSGKETTILYRVGGKDTLEREFTWEWIDDSKEGLIFNYGAGDILYFDNVWVREHYISGKLDGRIVVFIDKDYL